tara:strand:- start:379 stop:573 length:195 start_codon:yes stop_codon:yes gene_type:complete
MNPKDGIPTSTLIIVARHLIKNPDGVYDLDGLEHIRQVLIHRAKTNSGLIPLLKEYNAHFHYGD